MTVVMTDGIETETVDVGTSVMPAENPPGVNENPQGLPEVVGMA